MFCSNCGKQIRDDAHFCPYCGTDVQTDVLQSESAQPTSLSANTYPANRTIAPDRKVTKRNHMMPILAILFIALFAGGGFYYYTHSTKENIDQYLVENPDAIIHQEYEEDNTYIVSLKDGKEYRLGDYGDIIYDFNREPRFYVERDSNDEECSLYEIKKDSSGGYLLSTAISYFYPRTSYSQISFDGSTLLHKEASGWLYAQHEGITYRVSMDENSGGYRVSPNGKTVIYTIGNGDGTKDIFQYDIDGKSSSVIGTIDEGFLPVRISNDAGTIFFLDQAENWVNFYAYDKESRTMNYLTGGQYYIESAWLNYDCSEALYIRDGKSYYLKQGEKEQLLSDNALIPIRISGMQEDWSYQDFDILVYGITTFETGFFHRQKDIVYLDQDKEIHRIIEDPSSYELLPDGKTLFYVKNSDLYRVTIVDEKEETDHIATNVAQFYSVMKGKVIYYFDADHNLYMTDGKSQEKEIARGESYGTYQGAVYDDTVFYYTDGMILYLVQGEKATAISGVVGNITTIRSGSSYVAMYSEASEMGKIVQRTYYYTGDKQHIWVNKW